MYQTQAQQGWQCPICKRVLSPWTSECPCRGQVDWVTTTTTSIPKKDKTVTLTDDFKKSLRDAGLSQQEITYYEANFNNLGD